MALTSEQAIAQLQAAQSGKPSQGSGISGYIQQGISAALLYGTQHNKDIQAMIDQLLVQKGILSSSQEQQVGDLVAQEKMRQAKLKADRTKNALIFGGGAAVVIIVTYILLKKNKTNG